MAQKLKALKTNLRSLNSYLASYENHLNTSKQKFAVVQDKLAIDVLNQTLIEEEKCLFRKCTTRS